MWVIELLFIINKGVNFAYSLFIKNKEDYTFMENIDHLPKVYNPNGEIELPRLTLTNSFSVKLCSDVVFSMAVIVDLAMVR
jgi:hypothetical protein